MIQDSSTSTRELFVEELRMAYQQEWDLKDKLESKAGRFITISGTVATLLFGFGAFIIQNVTDPNYEFLPWFTQILIGTIIANIVSILLCTLSLTLQKYSIAMDYSRFYTHKGVNTSKVEEYKKSSRDTFNNTMITAYLECNKRNHHKNNIKVWFIYAGQWLFFGSMIMVPILFWILLNAMQSGAITFSSSS
jgi:hypothetical protein